MRENVGLAPAFQIERGAHGQEVETGLCELQASLADQHGFEARLDLVQVEHVACAVLKLRVCQRLCAPVRRLLGFGQVSASHFAGNILQAVPVGVGTREFRRDLGAPDRLAVDAEPFAHHRHVETGKVEQLQRACIGQEGLEIRAVEIAIELDDVRLAIASRQLDHAKCVTKRIEAHGLGVDGDFGAKVEAGRQIALVKGNIVHELGLSAFAHLRKSLIAPGRASGPARKLACRAFMVKKSVICLCGWWRSMLYSRLKFRGLGEETMRTLFGLLFAGLLALPAVSQDAASFGPGGAAMAEDQPAESLVEVSAPEGVLPTADRKIALLIGNQEYPDQIGDLATPHMDITTLAAALDATGFETYSYFDAERDEMTGAIKAYRDRLAEAKLNGGKVFGFIYIAGQGFSVGDAMGNQNLLMASRKNVWSADDLMKQTIDLEDSISTALSGQPDALFVVIDSVREGLKLTFNDPARPTGFAAYPPQPGLVIAYAAAPGERAPDDGEFAKTLAREIVVPDQLATVAINKALAAVAENTPSRGAPYIDLGRLDSHVCFNGCPVTEDEDDIDLTKMRPPTSSVTLEQPKAPKIPVQTLTSLISGEEKAAQAATPASGSSTGTGSTAPASAGPVDKAPLGGTDMPPAQDVASNAAGQGGQQLAQQASSVATNGTAASSGGGLLQSAAKAGADVAKGTVGAASGVATTAATTAASTIVGTQVAAAQAVQTQATVGAATAAAGVAVGGVKMGANMAGAGLKALTGGGGSSAGDAVSQASKKAAASAEPPRPAKVASSPPPSSPPASTAPSSAGGLQKAVSTSPSPTPSNSVVPDTGGLQTVSATTPGTAPSNSPTANSIREAFENSRQSSEVAAEQIADAEALAEQQATEQAAQQPKVGKAVPTKAPRPAYPEEALAQDIEGLCDVKFDVDTEGVPFNVTASCTDSVFERESVRALTQARFEKTLVDGQPAIRKGVTYPLEYKLK